MSKKILGKLQTRKMRMIGKNTVARLSSFRRIRPMFLGLALTSFEPFNPLVPTSFDPFNPFVPTSFDPFNPLVPTSFDPFKVGGILGGLGHADGLGRELIDGLKDSKIVFLFYCVFGQAVIILYQLAKLSYSLN
jgi:hypothetical protein